jgi:hypothetical protein
MCRHSAFPLQDPSPSARRAHLITSEGWRPGEDPALSTVFTMEDDASPSALAAGAAPPGAVFADDATVHTDESFGKGGRVLGGVSGRVRMSSEPADTALAHNILSIGGGAHPATVLERRPTGEVEESLPLDHLGPDQRERPAAWHQNRRVESQMVACQGRSSLIRSTVVTSAVSPGRTDERTGMPSRVTASVRCGSAGRCSSAMPGCMPGVVGLSPAGFPLTMPAMIEMASTVAPVPGAGFSTMCSGVGSFDA